MLNRKLVKYGGLFAFLHLFFCSFSLTFSNKNYTSGTLDGLVIICWSVKLKANSSACARKQSPEYPLLHTGVL